jgi:2-C-methyl-D-erythritol 2,4-cyclodiphosphate synthase
MYKESYMYRIGFSEDIHPIKEGRKLVLGGVEIPSSFGLDGHSDADVVLHSVSEAILGALALGDLGTHFPDNDEKYKGISSLILLKEVVSMMEKEGYEINNIDIQVACAKPKLAPYVMEMRKVISNALKTDIKNVSIKAMSFNKVGAIGRGEAIRAQSIVMLLKK